MDRKTLEKKLRDLAAGHRTVARALAHKKHGFYIRDSAIELEWLAREVEAGITEEPTHVA